MHTVHTPFKIVCPKDLNCLIAFIVHSAFFAFIKTLVDIKISMNLNIFMVKLNRQFEAAYIRAQTRSCFTIDRKLKHSELICMYLSSSTLQVELMPKSCIYVLVRYFKLSFAAVSQLHHHCQSMIR